MEKRALFCQVLRGAASDYHTLMSGLFLGLRFLNFPYKGGSDFSLKKGGVGKIGGGGCLEKGGGGRGTLSLIFIQTDPFQSYFSLSDLCVRVVLICLFQYSLCSWEELKSY